jgi:hypothetical protein
LATGVLGTEMWYIFLKVAVFEEKMKYDLKKARHKSLQKIEM